LAYQALTGDDQIPKVTFQNSKKYKDPKEISIQASSNAYQNRFNWIRKDLWKSIDYKYVERI